jgi:membrane protease YdiL (CAAX protease family)
MSSMSFAVTAALFEGGLAVLAVCIGWAIDRPALATFHFDAAGLGWGAAAVLPPLVLLWLCMKSKWPAFARIMRVLDDLFIPLFRQCRLSELLIIAVLAGLGEEMLFRAIIQGWLSDTVGGTYGIAVGLAVAAILFGLMHIITPTYALLAGLIGLYFGAIWLATGNLLVPITSHAIYDFIALAYLVYVRKSGVEPDSATTDDRTKNVS